MREGKESLQKERKNLKSMTITFFFFVCVIVTSFPLSPHIEFPSLSNYVSTNGWDQLPGCSQLTSVSHLQSTSPPHLCYHGTVAALISLLESMALSATICAHISGLTLSCKNSFCLMVWVFYSQIPCRNHIFHKSSQYRSFPKICRFWVACIICIQETAFWDVRCRNKAGLPGHFSTQTGKSILSRL